MAECGFQSAREWLGGATPRNPFPRALPDCPRGEEPRGVQRPVSCSSSLLWESLLHTERLAQSFLFRLLSDRTPSLVLRKAACKAAPIGSRQPIGPPPPRKRPLRSRRDPRCLPSSASWRPGPLWAWSPIFPSQDRSAVMAWAVGSGHTAPPGPGDPPDTGAGVLINSWKGTGVQQVVPWGRVSLFLPFVDLE